MSSATSASLMVVIDDDFSQTTAAMRKLQESMKEAAGVFRIFVKQCERWRKEELVTLSNLLSERSSRMMRES